MGFVPTPFNGFQNRRRFSDPTPLSSMDHGSSPAASRPGAIMGKAPEGVKGAGAAFFQMRRPVRNLVGLLIGFAIGGAIVALLHFLGVKP